MHPFSCKKCTKAPPWVFKTDRNWDKACFDFSGVWNMKIGKNYTYLSKQCTDKTSKNIVNQQINKQNHMPTAYRNKIYIKNKLSKQWQINH